MLSEVTVPREDLELIRSNLNYILDGPDVDYLCILSAFALMDIGTKDYEGKELWPGVEKAYCESVGSHMDFTPSDHKEWFSRFKKGVSALGMEWNFNVGRIQVDNILVHTFVPDVQLNKFMRFVHGFYIKILDGSLDNLEESLDIVPVLMDKNLAHDFDGYVGSLIPDPSLNKSTKKALSTPFVYKPLLRRILRMVHDVYTYSNLDEYSTNRYYIAFNKYLDSISEPRGRSIGPRNRMIGSLELEYDSIYIRVPELVCGHDDYLTVSSGGVVKRSDYQPFKHPLGDSGRFLVSEFKVRFDMIAPGLTPLDSIQISMGKPVWSSPSKKDFLLFNSSGKLIQKPIEGEISVYCRDDVSISPSERIDYSIGRVTVLSLHRNDVIIIGGKSFRARTSSVTDNEITYDNDANVNVTDQNGDRIDLLDDGCISCDICSPGITSYVLRIRLDDETPLHILINEDSASSEVIGNLYRDSDECTFTVPSNLLGDSAHIVTLGIYASDQRRVVEKRFLSIPGLKYQFDRPVYCDSDPGKLIVSVLDHPVEFDISQGHVDWSLDLAADVITLRHPIPALILSFDNGREWKLPPFESVRLSDLYYDHILLRNGAQFKLPMFFTDRTPPAFSSGCDPSDWFRRYGHPLDESVLENDRRYDISELRSEAIRTSGDSLVKVYYPGSSSDLPVMLFQISSRNKYSIGKRNDFIDMDSVSGARAVARFSIGDKVLKEVELREGRNEVRLDDIKGFLLSIVEYNPITDSYDLVRKERIVGEEFYCDYRGGIVYVVNVSKGRLEVFGLGLGCPRSELGKKLILMSNYNQWLSDRRIRDILWDSYKSLKVN